MSWWTSPMLSWNLYILIWQLLIYVNQAYQELLVVHGRFQRFIKFCSLAWDSVSLTVWREINSFLPETYCATRDGPCRLKAGMPCSGQPKWLSLEAQAGENPSSCDCPQLLLNYLNGNVLMLVGYVAFFSWNDVILLRPQWEIVLILTLHTYWGIRSGREVK